MEFCVNGLFSLLRMAIQHVMALGEVLKDVPVRNVQCQPQPNSVPFGGGHQYTTRGLVNIQ